MIGLTTRVSGSLRVAVDGHGDLCELDEAARLQAVEHHRKWFDVCHELACPAFRANSGGFGVQNFTNDHLSQCIRSFAQLAEWAADAGITILMENHGGLSADADRMVRVLEGVGSDAFRALADFRNFPPPADPYDSLARIAPHAAYVHAKFLNFDDCGEDPDFDTARVMDVFRQAGYRGTFGIEFEGAGDDHEGVIKSRLLLERYAYDL